MDLKEKIHLHRKDPFVSVFRIKSDGNIFVYLRTDWARKIRNNWARKIRDKVVGGIANGQA
jgi:hypothetical protein